MTDEAQVKIGGDNSDLEKSLKESGDMIAEFARMAEQKQAQQFASFKATGKMITELEPLDTKKILADIEADIQKELGPILATDAGAGVSRFTEHFKLLADFLERPSFHSALDIFRKSITGIAAALNVSVVQLEAALAIISTGVVAGLAAAKREALEAQLSRAFAANPRFSGYNPARDRTQLEGVSPAEAISGQASLLHFSRVRGEMYRVALQIANDFAATFGTSFEQAVQKVGASIQDPIAGISQLEQVGIAFTDSEKRYIEAMQNSMRLNEAQIAIAEKLKTVTEGAAAERATDLGQIWADIASELGNVLVTIGKVFLPTLKAFSQVVKELAITVGMMARVFDPVLDFFNKIFNIGLKIANFLNSFNANISESIMANILPFPFNMMVQGFSAGSSNIKETPFSPRELREASRGNVMPGAVENWESTYNRIFAAALQTSKPDPATEDTAEKSKGLLEQIYTTIVNALEEMRSNPGTGQPGKWWLPILPMGF